MNHFVKLVAMGIAASVLSDVAVNFAATNATLAGLNTAGVPLVKWGGAIAGVYLASMLIGSAK